MKEIRYRRFSLSTHEKNFRLKRPSVCQFELTFRCALHCRQCYTDCYNKPPYIKKELSTEKVRLLLDKIHSAGAIWLCLTGGDPLARDDFLDIYSYAKGKGFIITVFTSGYAVTDDVIEYFKRRPPFAIELTLNAATEDLYENISQVKGSFAKVMSAIDSISKAKLPLRIKTQVMRDNIRQLPRIEGFIRRLGLPFLPSFILYPRLNSDAAPCGLRAYPSEVLGLVKDGLSGTSRCDVYDKNNGRKGGDSLYPCVAGGGAGFYVDPYGGAFLCNLIREPRFNILEDDIGESLERLSLLIRERKFLTASRCNGCALKKLCLWCPGRAYLEKGDMESPIDYYCELAKQSNG